MVTVTHTRTDERIKKDLIDSLYWDNRVNAADVHIDVEEGTVTLTGTVPSYAAREAAFDDAMLTRGVIEVDNRLVVSYPTGVTLPSDIDLETNIMDSLMRNPEMEGADLEVAVDRGAVTLRGIVDSYWKKLRAEEIASNRSGVLKLKNELAVVPTGDYADRDIAEDIVAALERSPLVGPEHVNITVEDGEVTFTGSVPSWSARRAARRAASYTAGVIDVHDHLNITF